MLREPDTHGWPTPPERERYHGVIRNALAVAAIAVWAVLAIAVLGFVGMLTYALFA